MVIRGWQSTPYNKNQNFAERGWKDTKQKSNNLLNYSGAPKKCWLLVLQYVCFVLNHVAMASLGWRTPVEWLIGTTPDIATLLQFIFWEPVYYFAVEPKVEDTPELLGRFVGISENVGHAMTYTILTESDKVIDRAEVRSALKEGPFDNKRAKEAAPTKAPGPDVIEVNIPLEPRVRQPPTPEHEVETVEDEEEVPTSGPDQGRDIPVDMFADTKQGTPSMPLHTASYEEYAQDEDREDPVIMLAYLTDSRFPKPDWISSYHEAQELEVSSLPTINASTLVGRTFITDPDEEGEQLRAKTDMIEATQHATADGKEKLWEFRCRVGDKKFNEILTFNQMIEWCARDADSDDMFRFDGILDHRWVANTRKYEVLVLWATGEKTWNDLTDVWSDDPVSVAMYAKKNGLLHLDQWRRCRRIVKSERTLARMANQVRLKNYRNRPVYRAGTTKPHGGDVARR